MTGEKKSSDLSSRLSVKRGAKIISKASKPSSIASPPKAAIAAPATKKDEVHRRRNPFNDMLRRGGRESTERGKETVPAPPNGADADDTSLTSASQDNIDTPMEERGEELERELAMAKNDHGLLKDALEKAKDQGKADRDAIEDLRHQLAEAQQNAGSAPSRVSSEHERDRQRRLSSDRSQDSLLQQNYELRYRLGQLQEQLAATQDNMYRTQLKRETSSHGEVQLNELRSRLHMTEKESQERLQQLLSLKASISALTRVDSQITDSELAESFSQLANRVREWVIANFRRSKLNLDNLPLETVKALTALTPRNVRMDDTDRFALYQAIVSNAIMPIFQEPIVVGLPKTLVAFRQCAEVIHGAANEYREWRRVTIRAIEKSHGNTLKQGREEVLHQISSDISHLLFTLTAINLTTSAQTVLMGILNTAADLQHTLVLQKAQYHVLFFNVHDGSAVDFDDRRMESINDLDCTDDEDGDILTDRKVLFCVSPCLEKFGDEWGEHPDTSNILLKARVCCGVG